MNQYIQFYFLSEQYFIDFDDPKLMKNKEIINGSPHNRPCFFAFPDKRNSEIYWLVPISSNVEKYRRIEQTKIEKNGRCDTIHFGKIFDRECAFLIQNMCPSTKDYLTEYRDKNGVPVGIDGRIADEIRKKAQFVLTLASRGANIIFPDSLAIYNSLNKTHTYKRTTER